jgi:dihydroceramidase
VPFWEHYGTLSTVDWCEPNYVWVPYVAEWWNAWTSLPMGFVGLLGWFGCLSGKEKTPLRFHFVFLGLSAIGFGSVAFHGTLLRASQALDELPMIGLSLISLYCLAIRNAGSLPVEKARRKKRLWGIGSALYGLAFCLAYFQAESYFILFLVSYMTMAVYIVGRSLFITFRGQRVPLLEQVGWTALVAFAIGAFLLWIPEHVLLPCDHPLQALPLHAGWHLTSAVGAYGWGLWALIDHKRVLGQPARLEWAWWGPFVR